MNKKICSDQHSNYILIFSMYDVDGNGFIDLVEMTKIVKSIYNMMGPNQVQFYVKFVCSIFYNILLLLFVSGGHGSVWKSWSKSCWHLQTNGCQLRWKSDKARVCEDLLGRSGQLSKWLRWRVESKSMHNVHQKC